MTKTLIFKNTTTTQFTVIGKVVPATSGSPLVPGQADFTDWVSVNKYRLSRTDINALIDSGDLIINNGEKDFLPSTAKSYLYEEYLPPSTGRRGAMIEFVAEKDIRSLLFTRVLTFVSEGTKQIGEPQSIFAVAFVPEGETGEIRIFDRTTGIVASRTTFTNSDEGSFKLPTDGTWPAEPSIMEVQVRSINGALNQVHFRGLIIGY